MFLRFVVFVFFFGVVGDADFFEAVAQGVAREAQQARGLALVAVGAAVGFADDFVFPLIEGFAFGQESAGAATRGFRAARVEMNVRGVERSGRAPGRRRAR